MLPHYSAESRGLSLPLAFSSRVHDLSWLFVGRVDIGIDIGLIVETVGNEFLDGQAFLRLLV